jgi:hypothetical protein
LLASWKISIEVSAGIEEEERELMTTLAQAYLEWERKTQQRGIEQGQRLVVENLLQVRFGTVDKQPAGIVPLLLKLPTQEYTRLLLELSREELIARFQAGSTT